MTLTVRLHHLPLVLKVNKGQSSIFTSRSRLITVLYHSVQDGLCEIKSYKILDDLTEKCQPHQNLQFVSLIPAISLQFLLVLLCHKLQTIFFRSLYLFSHQICFRYSSPIFPHCLAEVAKSSAPNILHNFQLCIKSWLDCS